MSRKRIYWTFSRFYVTVKSDRHFESNVRWISMNTRPTKPLSRPLLSRSPAASIPQREAYVPKTEGLWSRNRRIRHDVHGAKEIYNALRARVNVQAPYQELCFILRALHPLHYAAQWDSLPLIWRHAIWRMLANIVRGNDWRDIDRGSPARKWPLCNDNVHSKTPHLFIAFHGESWRAEKKDRCSTLRRFAKSRHDGFWILTLRENATSTKSEP